MLPTPSKTANIQHEISKLETGGWKLIAWEPAPIEGNRVSPFMWRLNFQVNSQEEARQILQSFLECQ
jgi:hypothetical protein